MSSDSVPAYAGQPLAPAGQPLAPAGQPLPAVFNDGANDDAPVGVNDNLAGQPQQPQPLGQDAAELQPLFLEAERGDGGQRWVDLNNGRISSVPNNVFLH